MSGRLLGKVAIITGSTSGIGEATARRFLNEGASVVISGTNAAKGEALASTLGANARFKACDVRLESDIAALCDFTMAEFGRLDCMFNNAGASTFATMDGVTEDQFDNAMRLLVGSVVFGIKHAARHMGDSGGSIINNSSIAALRYNQGDFLYSTTKAAVTHLTKLAGVELGPRRIRVNSISPGAVATPIFWGGSSQAAKMTDEANAKKMTKLMNALAHATPLPRSGVSEDVAAAAVFLASEDGSFVNCHDLVVDGGRTSLFYERPADK